MQLCATVCNCMQLYATVCMQLVQPRREAVKDNGGEVRAESGVLAGDEGQAREKCFATSVDVRCTRPHRPREVVERGQARGLFFFLTHRLLDVRPQQALV
jgi:hypothetical protein